MRTLLFCLCSFAMSAQGIQFEHTSWEALLTKAKADQKLIFLDAYAAWCGPCKMMSNQTFTDTEVGKLYNASFVNAKIDMEKGEGPQLATRYRVEAYPTLLFVDGDGNVVHRALGYHDAAQFIALGTTAKDPTKNQRALDKRYAGGDRNPAFIAEYLAAKSEANDPEVNQLATDYLATQKDWTTPANMQLIQQYANDPASAPFKYFMEKRAQFTKQFGEEAVLQKAQIALGQYLQEHPKATLDEIQKTVRQIIGGEQGEKLATYYPIVFYQQSGDFDKFATAAVTYFDRYPPKEWNELNEMAWAFYENVNDPKMLEIALGWAKKSVGIETNYANTDTLAALYAKLGKKEDAVKTAKKAIELAKISGEDYGSTQALLESLTK